MEEIEIRHARIDDCPALGRILVSATHETFRGRVPDQCLNWITPEESTANWAKNFTSGENLAPGDYLFVAETKEVIGYAMVSEITPEYHGEPLPVSRYSHELLSIQVAPVWQRRGVGRRLLARIAEELGREKAIPLMVGVLAENPNIAFYERLGARRIGKRPYDWEGYATEEIVLGWEDINSLRK
jgi:ribosomal protein S18 acetylase RimI-like enzyme